MCFLPSVPLRGCVEHTLEGSAWQGEEAGIFIHQLSSIIVECCSWDILSLHTVRAYTLAKHPFSAREHLVEGHRKLLVCSGTLFSGFRVSQECWSTVPFPKAYILARGSYMSLYLPSLHFPFIFHTAAQVMVLNMTCGCDHTLHSMETFNSS